MAVSLNHIQQVFALAEEMSGHKWTWRQLMGCETQNACSAGFSWLHRKLFNKPPSCHWCCVVHDFLYSIGASRTYRIHADKILFDCAASAGGWRVVRAWIMYIAVRVGGWRYWSEP